MSTTPCVGPPRFLPRSPRECRGSHIASKTDKFEDHYESALIDLINRKRSGIGTTAKAAPKTGGNVINLMDALKRSLASERQAPPPAKVKGKKPKKRIEGQREMLLPISGKRAAKDEAKAPAPKKVEKPVRAPVRSKKAG